jgi:hypothetical protein
MKKFDHDIVLMAFFLRNRQKSLKFVIMTLTPDLLIELSNKMVLRPYPTYLPLNGLPNLTSIIPKGHAGRY